ncbi:MAG TPA: hypothetical protein VN108_08665 [Marmoricola sp.]|nr:hypothetical protein [Marmoricola sp.]
MLLEQGGTCGIVDTVGEADIDMDADGDIEAVGLALVGEVLVGVDGAPAFPELDDPHATRTRDVAVSAIPVESRRFDDMAVLPRPSPHHWIRTGSRIRTARR